MLHAVSKKKNLRFIISVMGVLLSFLFVSQIAQAATLSVSPAVAQVSLGNIVSVKVLVATNGAAINNADVSLRFPADMLEVLSVSRSSSTFSLWVEEPRFDNLAGIISLNGGVPTPGFTGQNGEVVSITFKTKKTGTATIVFSDSAVRANDGLGTNVLTTAQAGSIQINASAPSEIPIVDTRSNSLPSRPAVNSSTHPQQDMWYSGTRASFSWVIPNDVTSIQTLLSKSSTAVPTITYDASVSQRTVNNLADGVLYFHIRYQNNVGWGAVAHYKTQIDSTPPEKFTADVRNEGVSNILTLNATDATSGIDSYSIQIDGAPAIRVKKDALVNGEYVLPTQQKGEHELVVIAYDKAGNHTEADTLFVSADITQPSITVSPLQIVRGEAVTVSGKTDYPRTPIQISIQSDKGKVKSYMTQTLADGSYSVVSDTLSQSGRHTVWSEIMFSDVIQSPSSDRIVIQVDDTVIVSTSKSIIYGLSFIIPMIILIIVLIFLVYLGWHKFFSLRRKLSRETAALVNDTHKALMTFKDELNNQLEKLEKVKVDRDLNKKEEKIFKELQNNIDSIDEFIEKKFRKMI
jgi:Sec-independent protein translocase protein TatA